MKRLSNLAGIILLALGFGGCSTAHELADIATLGILGEFVPHPTQTSTPTRQRPSVEPQGGQKQAQLRRGTLTFTNSRYEGQLLNGKMHGQGTYTWGSGTRHVGKFRNGKFTGRGTRTWANGNRYEGDWHDNKMHGQGTYTWADGDRYVGDFRDDKRTGRGTFAWGPGKGKGHRYEGEFVDGDRHGQGTYIWPDGGRYVGQLRNNNFHGRGSRTWPNGDRYEGEFRNDKLHGQGTMTYADGTRHVGEWRDGKRVQGQQRQAQQQRERNRASRERHRQRQQAQERQRPAGVIPPRNQDAPRTQGAQARGTGRTGLWAALALEPGLDVSIGWATNHTTETAAKESAQWVCRRGTNSELYIGDDKECRVMATMRDGCIVLGTHYDYGTTNPTVIHTVRSGKSLKLAIEKLPPRWSRPSTGIHGLSVRYTCTYAALHAPRTPPYGFKEHITQANAFVRYFRCHANATRAQHAEARTRCRVCRFENQRDCSYQCQSHCETEARFLELRRQKGVNIVCPRNAVSLEASLMFEQAAHRDGLGDPIMDMGGGWGYWTRSPVEKCDRDEIMRDAWD